MSDYILQPTMRLRVVQYGSQQKLQQYWENAYIPPDAIKPFLGEWKDVEVVSPGS